MQWARDISHYLALAPQSLDIKSRGKKEWYREIFKDFRGFVTFSSTIEMLTLSGRGPHSSHQHHQKRSYIERKGWDNSVIIPLSRRGPFTTHWYATENYTVAGKTMAPTFHYKLRLVPGAGGKGEGADCTGRQLLRGQEKIKIKITRKTRKICQIR